MQYKKLFWLGRIMLFSGVMAFCVSPVMAKHHDEKKEPEKKEQVHKSHPAHTADKNSGGNPGAAGDKSPGHKDAGRTFGGKAGDHKADGRSFGGHDAGHKDAGRTFGGKAGDHKADGRSFGGHDADHKNAGRSFGGPEASHKSAGRSFGAPDGAGKAVRQGSAAPERVHGDKHFSYMGHRFEPFRGKAYHWPHGHAYHRPYIGWSMPLLFMTAEYIIYDYRAYGLEPPPPGAVWMRYGPDILLVDRHTGFVYRTIYGAFVD